MVGAVMKSTLSYYTSSLVVTLIALGLGALVGYVYHPGWSGALTALFLTAVLAVLEISLSFDNAVINATVLREMTPAWRGRFITWGMWIAVFGMRVVFPLAVVSLVARLNPWSALVLATSRPQEYAAVMLSAHVPLAGFGGAFLLLVCLGFFLDLDKQVHWLRWLERPAARFGQGRIGAVILTFAALGGVGMALAPVSQRLFWTAGSIGVACFLAVEGVSRFLRVPESTSRDLHRASAALFVYLEVLDASFSFDGVIGAFALTQNLFIIALGLGIGAMFVRNLTIMLVERRTLEQFRYLEHGAFYAIGALALIMFISLFRPVPEVLTGLIGAVLIALSFWSSRQRRTAHDH